MRNYYEVLGVDSTADMKEIKRAYARLLRQFPPETHAVEFKEIRKAYDVLSGEESRVQYDKSLAPIPFHIERPEVVQEEPVPVLWDLPEEETEDEKVTPETDFEEVKKLLGILYKNKEYQRAVDILNAAIDETNPRSSKNILYYIQMIKILIIERKFTDFTNAVDRMFRSLELKKDEEVAKYIFKQFTDFIADLYREKRYSYCRKLIESMLEVDPFNTRYREFAEVLNGIKECKASLHILYNDISIEPCLKELIALWLNESMEENERKKQLAAVEQRIKSTKKSVLLKSLKRLRADYYMFYRIDTKYFENLYKYLGKDLHKASGIKVSRGRRTYLAILITVIALRFISYVASYNGSGYRSSGNLPNLSDIYSGELNVELPSTLPEGYILDDVFIQYDKDGALEKLPKESYGYTMDGLTILRNVNYLKLTFTKNGKAGISFEANADEKGFKSNPEGNVNLTGDPDIGLSAFKDDGKEMQLLIYRASLQGFDPNNPQANVLHKWIDYTISTSSSADGASKEDLLLIAKGLKWVKIQ